MRYMQVKNTLNKYFNAVAKLEDMLVMHCMTNAVLEYHFYLKIPSTNCSAKRSYNKAYIC